MNWNTGDILYSKIQYNGCSYHYQFARVVKITPSGKYYRVTKLPVLKGEPERLDFQFTRTKVQPDNSVSDKYCPKLVRVDDGSFKEDSLTHFFDKYTPDLELYNSHDLGD